MARKQQGKRRQYKDTSEVLWFAETHDIPVMDAETTIANVRAAQAGDNAARDAVILGHKRWVEVTARKYDGLGLDFLELVNEGMIGMMRAIARFDTSKQNTFLTYASFWVRHYIHRAIVSQGALIRLPDFVAAELIRARLAREAPHLSQDVHDAAIRSLRMESLDSGQRFTKRQIVNAKHNLDTWMMVDGIEDGKPSPEDNAVAESEAISLRGIVQHVLDGRDREVIILRYGLDGHVNEQGEPGRTLAEAGKILGISRERVRQIEQRAMKTLQGILSTNREDGPVIAAFARDEYAGA